ncbi:alpha-L-arabinofuranosidase, partial [Medicago truncatula]
MSFSHMFTAFLFSLIVCLVISECHADVNANASHISKLVIDARTRRPIPDTFFGAFFEEINHAGAGGLWAELVDNR